MTTLPILVLNSGSSSIKFSIWEAAEGQRRKLFEGAVDGIGSAPEQKLGTFWIKSFAQDPAGPKILDQTPNVADPGAAFDLVAGVLIGSSHEINFPKPAAVGHRMVCGGPTVVENQRITPELIAEMERYTAFAPLHTPIALLIMRKAMRLLDSTPNFVCLDSWFHRDLPQVTRTLPIPTEYSALGLRRFGAHGLSYESIVAHLGPAVPPRMIVAHLGNGASICAMRDGKSIDTSMGLTPTGGLISGSRTGDIDPGVLLFLLRKLGETTHDAADAANQLETIVNKKSGLLGVSELTNDMRALRQAIAQGDHAARLAPHLAPRLAVDQFTYVIRKYIGSYIAVLGGLDTLVFTGGIGEHDPATRAEVCAGMEPLGIAIDADRNNNTHAEATISPEHSPVTVRVIPAAEDRTIVEQVCRLLAL